MCWKTLALALLVLAPVAQAQELTAPTTFEVTGAHSTWGAFRATLSVRPGPGGVDVVQESVLADGTRRVQSGRGTQAPWQVRATLPPSTGVVGGLAGAPAGPTLDLVLDHDGHGRCRVRALDGTAQVSLARGATRDAPEVRLDVAVLSDLNGEAGSTAYDRPVRAAVQALAARYTPDLVLVSGDMVAGQLSGWGDPTNHARLRASCRAMWSSFHRVVTTPLRAAGIPVAPAPGNHDASIWRPQERLLYDEAWPALAPGLEPVDVAYYPLRYAFVRGGVFFLALDATSGGRLETLEWARALLASPRAQACPVRIAYGHFPLHPTSPERRTAILHRSVEEAFAELDLTLYVAGHHHAYYPGAAGGVRQVVMPCLGGGRRRLIGQPDRSPHSLVLLQVRGGALTAVEAFQGATYEARVERASLPARLVGGLVRDDRAGYRSAWVPE